jgi:predicted GH43/DUF377 family glycosyl hydrolase
MVLAALLLVISSSDFKPWMIGPFYREDGANPVLKADTGITFFDPMRRQKSAWRHDNVFNPAEAVRNGKLCLLFRAEDASGTGIGHHTSRIGFASSSDGRHFAAIRTPVLFPSNDSQKKYDWPGGCEDPRVVSGPNGYVMTYTAWDGKTARLCVATSPDLIRWTKKGPAFGRAANGKWRNMWSKSGAIITKIAGDQLAAVKIAGRYWMYFGDLDIDIATSNNLIDWTPLIGSDARNFAVLRPRNGLFDSALCESGPPAVLTKRGIVLLYNGSNSTTHGDPSLPPKIYTAGQALFAGNRPWVNIARSNSPFLKPERPYEVTGQYSSGTVFIEGLAWFHRHWVLAYGAADSRVALARSK